MSGSPMLSAQVNTKLNCIRSMLRRYVIAQSLCIIVLWLLVTFWLGGLVDYLPVTVGSNETPRWLRVTLLGLMAGGCIWVLVRSLAPRLLYRLKDSSLALLIERKYPALNYELVTAIQLNESNVHDVSNPTAYSKMLDLVHASVNRDIEQVEPSEMFEWQPLWALVGMVIFAAVFTVLAAIAMPAWIGHWSNRLLMLSNDPWPRKARLRADGLELQVPAFTGQLAAARVTIPFVDQQAYVPTGAAALLQISADTTADQVPDTCTLFYQSSEGDRGRANLRRVGAPREGWQSFTIDGPPLDAIDERMQFDIVGLDARLRDLRINTVDPSAIVSMQLTCAYPSYLIDDASSRPAVESLEFRSGSVIPEGTRVTMQATASCELSSVEFVVYSSTQGSDQVPQVQLASVAGQRFSVPLGILTESQVVEVRMFDAFGLPTDQIPRYLIAVQPDTIPEVLSQIEGIGSAITASAMLPVRGNVTDDHALAAVNAEVSLDGGPVVQVPLVLGSQGELQSNIDLLQLSEQGRLNAQPGMTLDLVVSATDRYDLTDQPRLAQGQRLQFSIVTVDELLVILDRQELEQRENLELIMQELTQLRESLSNIQVDLSALNTPVAHSGREMPTWAFVGLLTLQEEPEDDAVVRQRAAIRAQQCLLQGDKSQQELASLAAQIEGLRSQLINNRIDSRDRQERLSTKVSIPLRALLQTEYRELQQDLAELMQATSTEKAGILESQQAMASLDKVLIQLDSIKSNMQDMESFNELVDMVRALVEDQDGLLKATEQKQQQRILELLQ
ncbi:MAG: hypothetical protein KDB22_01880 [Planctomycetales bacterium]|nr:hypothetical protein [Planctomycetales bacterium]